MSQNAKIAFNFLLDFSKDGMPVEILALGTVHRFGVRDKDFF